MRTTWTMPRLQLAVPSTIELKIRLVQTTNYFYTTQSRLLKTLDEQPFENIVGKGENAGT